MGNPMNGEAMPKTMTALLAKVSKLEDAVNLRTDDDDSLDAELERFDRKIKAYSVVTEEDAVALLGYIIRTGGLEVNLLIHLEKLCGWLRRATAPQISITCSGSVLIERSEVRA
ncbi:hypothetical protein [Pararhizobium sp. LjRoot238]|uniref:hypothetical protein n=1 Tax=Pararhizobium sp. LjRoot238 TaxID=3342293 RepID=UPI003ECDCE65